jgi:hypothetical protein
MLEYVSNILKNYHKETPLQQDLSKVDAPIRTSRLKSMIEERGATDKIHLYETDHESNAILAMIQMERGQIGGYSGDKEIAHIYFQKRLNLCWRRFVVCKEMYHCMLDRTEDERTSSVNELGRLIELLGHDTTSVSGTFKPYETERAAEHMALETLFPVEYRLKLVDDYRSGKISEDRIAAIFSIPKFYVPYSFQPTYLRSIADYRKPLLF